MLKSALGALTNTQNAPVEFWRYETNFNTAKTIVFFLVISAVMTSKLDPTFSSFNPFPSLPSLATDERKQFQCLNIVLNNKTEQLFLEFSWSEGTFKLFKKTANSGTLHLSPGERAGKSQHQSPGERTGKSQHQSPGERAGKSQHQSPGERAGKSQLEGSTYKMVHDYSSLTHYYKEASSSQVKWSLYSF